jgi:hypothetical protein
MAAYHDKRHHAKSPSIAPGDCVRLLLPRRSHKLARTFSDPHLVVKVTGNTVFLENGQRWNVRRCVLYRSSLKRRQQSEPSSSSEQLAAPAEPSEEDCAVFDIPLLTSPAQGPGQAVPLRRSARVHRRVDYGPVISH